ncbi:MAG TPA: hypothetical protein VG692_02620 [Gemmatimonadales bacterium]|nr:hypothetical protein [Gemmatimonadales bacterium]
MAPTSNFYFDGMAYGKDVIRDLPMFAIHTGQGTETGWRSAGVSDASGFRMLMEIVNPQVPVYLAMPRMYQTNFFTKDRTYSKLSVYAYRQVYGSLSGVNGGYLMGASIAMVLQDVRVVDIKPIMQWKGLPIPPQVQKNYLEKKIGRETYIPVAVQLFASQGDVV